MYTRILFFHSKGIFYHHVYCAGRPAFYIRPGNWVDFLQHLQFLLLSIHSWSSFPRVLGTFLLILPTAAKFLEGRSLIFYFPCTTHPPQLLPWCLGSVPCSSLMPCSQGKSATSGPSRNTSRNEWRVSAWNILPDSWNGKRSSKSQTHLPPKANPFWILMLVCFFTLSSSSSENTGDGWEET